MRTLVILCTALGVLTLPLESQETQNPTPRPGVCEAGYDPFAEYDGEYAELVAEPPEDLTRAAGSIIAGCFAWQTFMALNHSPDTAGGWVHSGAQGPTRWEAWPSVGQVFPDEGTSSCEPKDPHAVTLQLSMNDGLSAGLKPVVKKPRRMRCLEFEVRDRGGNVVWRDVTMDDTFVRSLDAVGAEDFAFEAGAMATKTAWKVYDPTTDPGAGYYVRQHTNGECESQPMALVGFHLSVKTERYPGWVWMTFEHKRNAPTATDVAAGRVDGWTFYDPSSDCPENDDCFDAAGNPLPTRVLRHRPMEAAISKVNSYWRDRLPEDSVWRNYSLNGVEWSRRTRAKQAHGTKQLANSILETQCQQVSCYACHRAARSTDMVFTPLRGRPVASDQPSSSADAERTSAVSAPSSNRP